MKKYQVEWKANENHTILQYEEASSPEEALNKVMESHKDYLTLTPNGFLAPKGELKVTEWN